MNTASVSPILATNFPNLVKMGWITVRPCPYNFEQLRRMKLHAAKNSKKRGEK